MKRVDLGPWLNNVGATRDSARMSGEFDSFGRSFPKEEVLVSGSDVDGAADNVQCEGQRICFSEPVNIVGIRVIGACDGGTFCEPIGLVTVLGGVVQVSCGLTDWLASAPHFGETIAAFATHVHEPSGDLIGPRPRLWCSTAIVAPCRQQYVAVQLPVNPSFHLFAVELLMPGEQEGLA